MKSLLKAAMIMIAGQAWGQEGYTGQETEWMAFEFESDLNMMPMQPYFVDTGEQILPIVPVIICSQGDIAFRVSSFGLPESESIFAFAFALRTDDYTITSDEIWREDEDSRPVDFVTADFLRVAVVGSTGRGHFIVDARQLAELAFQHREVCGL